MKAVVLAGGRGRRLGRRTERRPKALVEVGGRPILWHVMRLCAHHGLREFLIAAGYRGEQIERHFGESGDEPGRPGERWRVEVVHTGPETETGGRVGRLRDRLSELFVLAWCDGVTDLDLGALLAFHRAHGRLATLAAVRPPSRFGHVEIAEGGRVERFEEKPERAEEWVSGGFFALQPGVLDYVEGDRTDWDREVLVRLAEAGELMAYRHHSFWRCMDTPEDARTLDSLCRGGAPWAVWS